MSGEKDTPEQARLRTAIAEFRSGPNSSMKPWERCAEFLAAAEAMLPREERWADYSKDAVRLGYCGRVKIENKESIFGVSIWHDNDCTATRAQAIRAAVLLKHSKRLMDTLDMQAYSHAGPIYSDIVNEAERLIAEAGV